ncbi:selenocysteine synthase [Acidipila rosea]|uniref:L-seryl-tRNA(Ser) seleniumtransferase n=1 Tax=Acidipila rosea TaxID=768535 RepID=A0A4R1L699_9BACT|nr:selenocysteine synthase [Acidipila rosea]TCK72717.1 L-seryl-tRNA(Ser) seleniumtransferase [Acidipila rosea]
MLSRRRFLSSVKQSAVGISLLPVLPSAVFAQAGKSEESADDDYYAKLGVAHIINAAGTYTYLTAAIMPPQVQRAVAEAAKHPVRLKDLQVASGEYLAKKLKCEGALVSAGAASALTLGTAACMALANNVEGTIRVPQGADAMKNEVIVQKGHRYEYDQALLNCGIQFREVVTESDYRNAFSSKTVMTHFFNAAESGEIDRETWLKIAHEHNVPCMNDAAADMPPIENLWKYTGMGFDLVCFSGGKGIRGPQNAGLLLGKKKLIDLAYSNNSPISDAVGRGMKVAKEQIVGMVAAVDWLLEQSNEAMQDEYKRRVDVIIQQVKDIPTMKASTFMPEVANHVPHLLLEYNPATVGVTVQQAMEMLRKGTPSIELNPATGTSERTSIPSNADTIVVGVWMLQPGEDAIVGSRLRQVLTARNA